jgi:hypothetical protein
MSNRPIEPIDEPLAKKIKQKLRKLDSTIDAIACTPTRHALSEHIAAMQRLILKNQGEDV